MDVVDLPAVEQLRLLGNNDLSCRELLEACRQRAEITERVVNALPTTDWGRADQAAKRLDDDPSHQSRAPLRGLVTAHKDLLETAGVRTTYGSPIFAGYVPDTDHPLVAALREAGLVSVGKTNTPEFGAGSHTFNPVHGPTRNPWNPHRSAGGSSGGATAALACGAISLADGGDLGGSLRNPASFCGVVGFRPTAGSIPYSTEQDSRIRMPTNGPLGRSVDDVIALHSVMAPEAISPPLPPENPRIALAPELGDLPLDRSVRGVVESAAGQLEAAGWSLEYAAPDLEGADPCFEDLRALGFALKWGALVDDPRVKSTVRTEIRAGRALSEERVAAAILLENRIRSAWDSFFSCYDALLCATSQVPPFPLHHAWVTEIDGSPMSRYTDWMRSCSRITVPGGPAISIPAGFTDNGLPVGLQLSGARHQDRTLLALAGHAEAVLNVARRPPIEDLVNFSSEDLPEGPPSEFEERGA
ncbi:MAG: amidase family protein [Actinomycetota bacterium]|nr:amidase family protein [Actinomycetota bacterium]